MQSTFEEITPERAAAILKEYNTGNREMRMENVKRLAAEMTAGNWMKNGDSIRFAKNGRLLDGQHRLRAVIESGVTIWSYIIRDLEEETFITMDIGKVRTGADILFSHGFDNGKAVAAVVRIIIIHRYTGFNLGVVIKGRGQTDTVTNAQILEFIKVEDVSGHARYGSNLAQQLKRSYTPAEFGFLSYIFSKSEKSKYYDFFTTLVKGTGLTEENPIWVLRKKIEQKIANPKVKVTQFEKLAWAIKTWNAYLKGNTIRMLNFDNNKEAFPAVYSPNAIEIVPPPNVVASPKASSKSVGKDSQSEKVEGVTGNMPDDFEFPGELDQYPESIYGNGDVSDEFADQAAHYQD